MTTRAVVFVEGESDRIALTTLASKLGFDLQREGVLVTPMGGSSAFQRFIGEAVASPDGALRIGGLCDEAEQFDVVRALTSAGLGAGHGLEDLATAGFFVCRRDLEDELIRAVGTDGVVDAITIEGDGPSLQRLQHQPAWREQPLWEQLRRFMSSQSGRKARYARVLIERLDTEQAPKPLRQALHHAVGVDA